MLWERIDFIVTKEKEQSMIQRKSNFELLRIVSIILIIIYHLAFHSGFSFDAGLGLNKFIVKTFVMFGELGVNLFVLISGYFMINGRFKWKKLILLIAEVLFYHILTILLACKLGLYELSFTPRNVLLYFFPITMSGYWFITAYVIIYLLSPYFNILAKAMDKTTYKKFLLTVLFLYSFVPTLLGIFYDTTEFLFFYSRLIWLIIIYFMGAYIRLHSLSIISTMKASAITSAGAFGVLAASILIIDKFNAFFASLGTIDSAYFWPPNSIPMVFWSIGIFGIFLHLKLSYHPLINRIASTTLGIYILHDGMLRNWLWPIVFRCADYQNAFPLYLICRILFAAGSVFVVGVIIDLMRQLLEKYTLQKILDWKLWDRIAAAIKKYQSAFFKDL